MSWKEISKEMPPVGVRVLFYWRPVDHKVRPFHREIIIGQVSAYDNDWAYDYEPVNIWANGMYYNIKEFVTHWMPLPDEPD
jgi:hypothetical protein